MDSRERASTTEETIRMAFQSMEAGLWTAIPGIIQSFNATAMTCVVLPAIQAKQRNKEGVISNVTLPQLLDCPVVFPSGGGFSLTFPLTKGNECLVVFASRCIDAWWQQGGVQPPMELRMHDLSDGFVLPGCFSQPNVLPSISTTTTQLRNKTGTTYVEIAGGGIVNVIAPTQINLTTPLVVISGAITVNNSESVSTPCTITGSLSTTGDVVANGISLDNHYHGGVATGGGNTGGPIG